MKNLLTVLCFLLILGCGDSNIEMPMPTDGTIVLSADSESEGSQGKREKWIESMHFAKEGVNWRKIERENDFSKAKRKVKSTQKAGQEIIGDGLLYGEWKELGSSNQAGAVQATEYDQDTDLIWLVSDGGTIYKGLRDGSNWEVVNQDFRFDSYFLKLVEKDNDKRLLAIIEGIPAFSDDYGITWTLATGTPEKQDGWGGSRNFVLLENQGELEIFCLSKESYWDNIKIMKSTDIGETYVEVERLNLSLWNMAWMLNPHHSTRLFLMTDHISNRAFMNEYNFSTNSFEEIGQSDFVPGDEARHFCAGFEEAGEIELISYNKSGDLYRSKDLGLTWDFSGNMPERPWYVGVFISPSKHEQLFFGAVECYKSIGSGFLWNKINNWGDYYTDVDGSLHADIMVFNEFETSSGETFQLISNHGGLSISYDYLNTVQNIGKDGLNVGQYYDVKTDPNNHSLIYAGTQDQGFQRGTIDGEGPNDLVQVVSGDYGHITFSRNGEGMWIMYPGGAVSFYNNPQTGNSVANWNLQDDNDIWIPPLQAIPGTMENKVYMAGGSADEGAGSYVIELRYWAGGIQTKNLPFDFNDYSGGYVSAIEVSPLNPKKIYVATDNGFFFYSNDGGQNFELSMISVPEPHYLYGSTIYASRTNENEVYIGGSGYSNAPVFYSSDMGSTFSAFDTGLPSTLVFELTANEDESLFFAASEAGPYVYIREAESWFELDGLAAPNTRYWSVEWLEEEQIARFGTYGRGAWDFEVQEEPVGIAGLADRNDDFKLYPNPASSFTNLEIENLEKGEYLVSILSMDGKEVTLEKVSQVSTGFFKYQLNFEEELNGNYFVKVIGAEESFAKLIFID